MLLHLSSSEHAFLHCSSVVFVFEGKFLTRGHTIAAVDPSTRLFAQIFPAAGPRRHPTTRIWSDGVGPTRGQNREQSRGYNGTTVRKRSYPSRSPCRSAPIHSMPCIWDRGCHKQCRLPRACPNISLPVKITSTATRWGQGHDATSQLASCERTKPRIVPTGLASAAGAIAQPRSGPMARRPVVGCTGGALFAFAVGASTAHRGGEPTY